MDHKHYSMQAMKIAPETAIPQRFRHRSLVRPFRILLPGLLNLFGLWKLSAQEPVYLEKYTITKIYFEGAENLNRYYLFSYLQFREGETYTPLQLQTRMEDSRRALRTQWYFQADFDARYSADGQVEIYVLLEPGPKRLSFMGGRPDGHSLYIGFTGERKIPGSAFRFHLGKSSGISWYLPRLGNSLFGLNLLLETEIQRLPEQLNINRLGEIGLWMRGGIKEFIQPTVAMKFGFAQEYWGTLNLNPTVLTHEVITSAIIDLNWLYLLKSRLWAMQFYLRADTGILTGLLLLRSQYKLLLLPTRWLELNFYLSGVANVLKRLPIGALDAEVPDISLTDNENDLYALGRLRAILLLSQNDYDNRTEFNVGFALEGKFGLKAGIFESGNLQQPQFGIEIQGGMVLDVLTPGAFTTRFFFLTGIDLLRQLPVAEFMVESRF